MNLTIKLPSDWHFPALEELALAEKGAIKIGPFGSALKKHEYSNKGVRVLGIDHVLPNELIWTKPKFIPLEKYEELRQYTVQGGDILVTNMGTVGRTCFVPENFPKAIISSHLIKVTLDYKKAYPAYISWALNFCPIVLGQIKAKCQGAIMDGFNSSLLKSLQIPLPLLPEQRRIAAILDKADTICRKRVEAIRLADDFLKSAFLDIVGPGATSYERWPEKTISELAAPRRGAMRTGPFGSNLRHSEFVDEGIAVLGIDNAVNNRFEWAQRRFITEEKYAELKQYTVFPEDVIITIMGTTGRTAVVPKDIPTAISTKHLATITLNRKLIHPQFIAFSVRENPDVLHQIAMASKGAIMDGLNLTIIKDLRLRVPPLDVQDQFEALVMRAELTRSRLLSLQNQADKLFGSLVQRAFRGEL